MKPLVIPILILTVVFSVTCNSKSGEQKQKPQVTFSENDAQESIDVLVDRKLFTTYRWPDNVSKPVLYPVYTSAGTAITREFPIDPKAGERADHPHQIGMWLTYGNVKSNDFWGNGSHGLVTWNPNGGVIQHLTVDKKEEGPGEGVLATTEIWADNTCVEMLREQTEYHFLAEGSTRIIDRITTLVAVDKDVNMPDIKEGMFGIRVARELELPSQGTITLYNEKGEAERVNAMSNEGITGNCRSREGKTGLGVWGTRARWMDLYGSIGDEKISHVIYDHPENQSYPTWWHAREYGLFSVNPLGANDFTKGEEQVSFSIPAGKSTTFRYRVIISSGKHLTDEEINVYTDKFAGKYN